MWRDDAETEQPVPGTGRWPPRSAPPGTARTVRDPPAGTEGLEHVGRSPVRSRRRVPVRPDTGERGEPGGPSALAAFRTGTRGAERPRPRPARPPPVPAAPPGDPGRRRGRFRGSGSNAPSLEILSGYSAAFIRVSSISRHAWSLEPFLPVSFATWSHLHSSVILRETTINITTQDLPSNYF